MLQFKLRNSCVFAFLLSFSLAFQALASPVRYLSFRDQDQGQPVQVNVVEVNLKAPGVDVNIATAQDRSSSVESVGSMAKRHRAHAAINGSFFHGTTMDSPVGLLIRKGEVIADSGHRRTSMGLKSNGEMVMGIPKIKTGLYRHGQKRFQKVNGVNQPRKSRQTIVYTPRFGRYTHTNEWGREVVVRRNRVVRYSYGNTAIPHDGFIISAHGKAGREIQKLYPLGLKISLDLRAQAPWDEVETVITGAPHLVHKGRIHNTYFQERLQRSLMKPNARSAVGFTHNDKLLLLNAVPAAGNQGGGITFTRLAQIMRRLGAYEAMALDGGGSTTLYVKEKGLTRASRPVTNALIITTRE